MNQSSSRLLYDAFYSVAEETFNYDFPIEEDTEWLYRGEIYGVELSESESAEIYGSFKDEAESEKLPLSYFITDHKYPDNALASFGYGSDTFVISLDTPKTCELFLDMICSKGSGYELDSFLDSVANKNIRQNIYELKLIFWDEEEKIRYEHFSWNFPVTPELSNEELLNFKNIISNHETDKGFSLDKRFLIAIYSEVNSGEWNCIKMNISEEEAEIMRGIIWSEGYLSDELNN